MTPDAADAAIDRRAPASVPRAPSPAASRWRAASVAALAALIGVGLGWELAWAPTGRGTLAWKVLPLAFFVAGLLRHRLATARALSLFVWLYVLEGAVRAAGPGSASTHALAAAQVALGVALFAACAGYVRARLRDGRPAATPGAGA